MIANLKDLEKLLKLCRKQGVTKLSMGDVTLELGEMPQQTNESIVEEIDPANPYANFPQGDLTPEQLMFYSSGGDPLDDPDNKDIN